MSTERRALVAIGLSLAILFAWQVLFPPPEPPPAPPLPETEAVDEVAALPTGDDGPPSAVETPAGESPPRMADASETVRVETADALVVFTNKGGRILSWKLKTYKDADGNNLELVPGGDLQVREERWNRADLAGADAAMSPWLPLAIDLPGDPEVEADANSALFQVERRGSSSAPEVVLSWADGRGHEVVKSVRLDGGFQASVHLEVRRAGRAIPAGLAWGVDFGESLGAGHGSNRFIYRGQAVVDDVPKPTRLLPSSLDTAEIQTFGGERAWGGVEDTYFAALFLPEPHGSFQVRGVQVPSPDDGSPAAAAQVFLRTDGDTTTRLYVGPKDFQLLSALEAGIDGSPGPARLSEVVYFQSRVPFVTTLTRALFHALVFLHTRVVANWGVAIVILTFLIRLLFWPLTGRSGLSMKRMQEKMKRVQPKVQAIRERYRRQGKKDIESRQKMQQEIMALYQKESINPASNLAGCLPLLLQLPILFGFYNLLQAAIELRQAPFILWVNDLASMDPYYVLPVLMGGSMLVQQVLTGAAIPDPVQRRMMYMTPVIFTVFFLQMPSGLVLYWLVNNMLGILQQTFINQRFEREKTLAAAPSRPARKKPTEPTGKVQKSKAKA